MDVPSTHGDPKTGHFLVYATSCHGCRAVAQEAAAISDGLLQPVQYDQAVTRFRGASIPAGEPSIVTVERNGIKVRRGAAMARFTVRRLGIRRSIRLKQLLDNVIVDSSRRSFFRAAAGGMLVLAGIGSASPAAASASAKMVEGAELDQLLRRATSNSAFRDRLSAAAERGFDTASAVNVAARWESGEAILITSLASRTDPENEAELVFFRISAEGSRGQVSGRVTARSELPVSSTSARAGSVETQSVKGFIGCVLANAGGQCGSSITYCANLRFWQLIIACLAGRCGPTVVRAAWKCRSAL